MAWCITTRNATHFVVLELFEGHLASLSRSHGPDRGPILNVLMATGEWSTIPNPAAESWAAPPALRKALRETSAGAFSMS